MAVFQKFEDFIEQTGKGLYHFNTDTIKVYLTNTAPLSATHKVYADIPDITAEHGYPQVDLVLQPSGQKLCVGSLTGTDVVFTADSGSFGPFRYVILYNFTATNKPLIGFWDSGETILCVESDTFTVDFGTVILTCSWG